MVDAAVDTITSKGRLRLGVLGAGGIADRRTLPVMGQVPNCELAVVMDVREPEQLARKYGVDWTDSLDEVLERDDVDAVYIASPVHIHAEQAIAAATAGKHILCEKPLARTLDDAVVMVDECCRARVFLREAYMLRHHGAHLAIKRLLEEGTIGSPVFATVHWAFLYPRMEGAWRQRPELGGGGALADVGCHVFNLLEMLVGRIKRVCSVTGTLVQDYPVEDLATVLLEFESGAQGTVMTSFCLPSTSALTIHGTEGTIVAHTLSQEPGGEATIYTEADCRRRAIEYREVNTYLRQMETFASEVLGGAVTTIDSCDDPLRTMRVLRASYQSAATGEFVDIG